MAMDHTNCTHPRTSAGRRACRAGQTSTSPKRETWPAGLVPPRRIQPRRSGARVSVAGSSCVQAALHTRGRCACGWENWDVA